MGEPIANSELITDEFKAQNSPYFFYDDLIPYLNLDDSLNWKLTWSSDEVTIDSLNIKNHIISNGAGLPIQIEELKPAGSYRLISSEKQLVETSHNGAQYIPTSLIELDQNIGYREAIKVSQGLLNPNSINKQYNLLVDDVIVNDAGFTHDKQFQTLDVRDVSIYEEHNDREWLDAFYSALPFTSQDANWSLDDFGGDKISILALDAHFGIDQTLDYYFEHFHRNSLDGNGSTVLSLIAPMLVEGGEEQDGLNAFSSSSFEEGGTIYDRIVFYDGVQRENGEVVDVPAIMMTDLSVVGHELTHSLITHEGDLTYTGLSGSLNEAFADIFGMTINAYTYGENEHGNPDWDWVLKTPLHSVHEDGEPLVEDFRTPFNPGLNRQPDTYQGEYWADPNFLGDGDSGGVHINSGVINYWYVLGVEGSGNNGYGEVHTDTLFGSHENYTNDNGFIYDVEGIGLEKMQGVVYHALTEILIDDFSSNATFENAREATIQAAHQLTDPQISNLYPGVPTLDAVDVDTIVDAWNAVGVGGGLAPTTI